MKWVLGLLVVGVVLAVVIGVAGSSQTVAERQFCKSLSYLSSSVQTLTSLSPSSASGDFESDAEDVRNGWNNIEEQSSNVSDVDMKALGQSWDAFSDALQSVPSNASISQSEQSIAATAESLEATLASTMKSMECS